MPWLVRDENEVLAPAEIARRRSDRRRGLLGRDGLAGVLVLEPCRQVHSMRMRFAIDVVWCDARGRVLRIGSLARGRISRLVLGARFVVEAPAGCAAGWGLSPGDRLKIVDTVDRS